MENQPQLLPHQYGNNASQHWRCTTGGGMVQRHRWPRAPPKCTDACSILLGQKCGVPFLGLARVKHGHVRLGPSLCIRVSHPRRVAVSLRKYQARGKPGCVWVFSDGDSRGPGRIFVHGHPGCNVVQRRSVSCGGSRSRDWVLAFREPSFEGVGKNFRSSNEPMRGWWCREQFRSSSLCSFSWRIISSCYPIDIIFCMISKQISTSK